MMSETNKDGRAGAIGHRIKSLRRSAGLSQSHLGNALGVTFQQVQKYESGRSRIAAEKLSRIAEALGVEVAYFYDAQPQGAAAKANAFEKAVPRNDGAATPEAALFRESFDRIRDPRARYLLAELARVFCEIESDK